MINRTLRGGGGICQSRPNQVQESKSLQKEKEKVPIQQELQTNENEQVDRNQQKYKKLIEAINKINEHSTSLTKGEPEIKQSIQYIHLSEYWIFEIMQTKTLLNYLVDSIQESIHALLQSARTLVKQDSLITQQLLYIISLFMMMLFKFQITNSKPFISENLTKQWLDDIKGLENELNIEKIHDSYRNQIDYEIYVITSIVMISNMDSNEGFEILKDMFIGTQALNEQNIFSIHQYEDSKFHQKQKQQEKQYGFDKFSTSLKFLFGKKNILI